MKSWYRIRRILRGALKFTRERRAGEGWLGSDPERRSAQTVPFGLGSARPTMSRREGAGFLTRIVTQLGTQHRKSSGVGPCSGTLPCPHASPGQAPRLSLRNQDVIGSSHEDKISWQSFAVIRVNAFRPRRGAGALACSAMTFAGHGGGKIRRRRIGRVAR